MLQQNSFKGLKSQAILGAALGLILLNGCSHNSQISQPTILAHPHGSPIEYVALGDSYTEGIGASPGEDWPTLLTNDLRQHGLNVELVKNTACDGCNTQEAMQNQLPVFDATHPKFTTLLIGVNDWWQNVNVVTFRAHIQVLLNHLQARLPQKNRLVVMTIPDCSLTPVGAEYGNPDKPSRGIVELNGIIKEEAHKRHLPLVDLYVISQGMAVDSGLIASDHLHPSAAEYSLWEKQIYPVVVNLLRRRDTKK